MIPQKKLMKINAADNVLVICQAVVPGDHVEVDGLSIHFDISLAVGHKVAARPIGKGEKVIKFGVPIGSATQDIPSGGHVHLHNLKSDYLSTYTLDNEFISKK